MADAGRRSGDRGWRRLLRENWYRDVWLVVVTGVVVLALSNADEAIQQQREGRREAVTVTCATLSSVIEAGRASILAGVDLRPPEFARNLERLGYPRRPTRLRNARAAADAYAASIARGVEREAHTSGIVRPDGTLNCARLRKVSRAN